MAETPSTFLLKPGDAAPEFTLAAPDGQSHSLADVAGPRGLLVVFACNHCPYVVMLAGRLGQLADEWKTRGVGVVAIASNDVTKYPQDGPAHMPGFAAEKGWNFPYLCDPEQEVAKAYGAACTPDFFLFDADLRLFYAGQFDDARPKNGMESTGADLAAAVAAMLAGEQLPGPVRPSTGCNIKWLEGNEPPYFG